MSFPVFNAQSTTKVFDDIPAWATSEKFLRMSYAYHNALQSPTPFDICDVVKAKSAGELKLTEACVKTCDFFATLVAKHEFSQFLNDASSIVPEYDWSELGDISYLLYFSKSTVQRTYTEDTLVLRRTLLYELFVGLWIRAKERNVYECDLYGFDKHLFEKDNGGQETKEINCHLLCQAAHNLNVAIKSSFPFCNKKKDFSPVQSRNKNLYFSLEYVFSSGLLPMFQFYNEFLWDLYKFRLAEIFFTPVKQFSGEDSYA